MGASKIFILPKESKNILVDSYTYSTPSKSPVLLSQIMKVTNTRVTKPVTRVISMSYQ